MSLISVKDLKNSSKNPESLIVLGRDDLSRFVNKYEEGEFLLDSKVSYLIEPTDVEVYKECKDTSSIENKLINSFYKGYLKPKNILLLSKATGDYIPYEIMTKQSIESRLFAFMEMCQMLGAKEVKIESNFKENSEDRMSGKSRDYFEFLKGGFEKSIVYETVKILDSSVSFGGSSDKDLESAMRIVESGIFYDSPDLMSFYNMAIREGNNVRKHCVRIELSSDILMKLRAIADIDAKILKKTIGEAGFEKLKQTTTNSFINYKVEF